MARYNSSVTTFTGLNSTNWLDDKTSVTLAQLTPHAPIAITSESQFGSLGFSGNGSESNPYLIEDLEIEATSGVECISISGAVLAHYEIRGCRLYGSDPGTGIELAAGHGLVNSCEIYDCSVGILIESNRHRIVASEIHDNSLGINALSADDVVVADSTFYDNTETVFEDASSLTIIDNTFSNNSVYIGYSVGITATSNTFATGSYLSLLDCQIGTINNNDFTVKGYTGIGLRNTEHVIINGNDFMASGPDDFGKRGVAFQGTEGQRDIIIQSCSFQSVGIGGGEIEDGFSITDCTFTNGSIYLYRSPAAEINNNTFNGGAITLNSNCTDAIISDNTINAQGGLGIGIHNQNNTGVMVSSNSVRGVGLGNGITIESAEVVVCCNTVENFEKGIFLTDATDCRIYNNTVFNNDMGIEILDRASSNTLYYNTLYGNTQNANDDGSNNTWDDGISLGNYWGNLIAPREYTIPGTAGSVDHYAQPFRTGLDIPLYLIIGIGVGVVVIIGALVCLKRR